MRPNVYLVFDTETTGLPQYNAYRGYHDPSRLQHYESSRLLSISWILLDSTTLEIRSSATHYIKPDGFAIPQSSIDIHGITEEVAHAKGRPIDEVLEELMSIFNEMNVVSLVAHNISFDVNVLASECFRYDRADLATILTRKKQYCTMRRSRAALGLRKNPKLGELYRIMYGEEITNAHDAEYDTMYCCRCFCALRKREIQIEKEEEDKENRVQTSSVSRDESVPSIAIAAAAASADVPASTSTSTSTDTFDGAITRSRAKSIAQVRLNDQQMRIVTAPHVPGSATLVKACAGSGKTTTVIERIRYLVMEYGVPENKIILTTFTNHAAAEMQLRLTQSFGYKPEVLVGTFDSLSLIIMGKSQARESHHHVSQTRSVGEYSSELLSFLRDTPDGEAFLANCCAHIFVDEFQDVNDIQFDIVRAFHNRGDISVTCVGDVAQNIYTFRDSNIRYMQDFKSVFPDSDVFLMTKNYRSTPSIVGLANAIVFNTSKTRTITEMVAAHPVKMHQCSEPLPVRYFDDIHRQNIFVLKTIRALLKSGDKSPGEIAVLCPHNRHLFAVEELLTRHKIPNVVLDHTQHADPASVCLSTIHKAKGLEWDTVFLIMMHDDVLPISKSSASEIDEGRRLFYVGVTRAREALHMLFAPIYAGGTARMSRYISELRSCGGGVGGVGGVGGAMGGVGGGVGGVGGAMGDAMGGGGNAVVKYIDCQSRHYFTATLPKKRPLPTTDVKDPASASATAPTSMSTQGKWNPYQNLKKLIADVPPSTYASLRSSHGAALDDLLIAKRTHIMVYDTSEYRSDLQSYLDENDLGSEFAVFSKLIIQKALRSAFASSNPSPTTERDSTYGSNRNRCVEEIIGSVFLDYDERQVYERYIDNFTSDEAMRSIGSIVCGSSVFRKRTAVIDAFMSNSSNSAGGASKAPRALSSEDMGIVLRILRKIEKKTRALAGALGSNDVIGFPEIQIVPFQGAYLASKLPDADIESLATAYRRYLSIDLNVDDIVSDVAVLARAEVFHQRKRRSILYRPMLDVEKLKGVVNDICHAFVDAYVIDHHQSSGVSTFDRCVASRSNGGAWIESFVTMDIKGNERQRILEIAVSDQGGGGSSNVSFEDVLHGVAAKAARENLNDDRIIDQLVFFNPMTGISTQFDLEEFSSGAEILSTLITSRPSRAG